LRSIYAQTGISTDGLAFARSLRNRYPGHEVVWSHLRYLLAAGDCVLRDEEEAFCDELGRLAAEDSAVAREIARHRRWLACMAATS
jgi:hypothetical protein